MPNRAEVDDEHWKGRLSMIWWVGASFIYIIVMAAICVFFRGASTFDRSMEVLENRLLPHSMKAEKNFVLSTNQFGPESEPSDLLGVFP